MAVYSENLALHSYMKKKNYETHRHRHDTKQSQIRANESYAVAQTAKKITNKSKRQTNALRNPKNKLLKGLAHQLLIVIDTILNKKFETRCFKNQITGLP